MADEQIEKALECCSKAPTELEELYEECANCPYNEQYPCSCELATDALALVKRQREEIDGLRKEVDYWVEEVKITRDDLNQSTAEARAEAIREFAERMDDYLTDSYRREKNAATYPDGDDSDVYFHGGKQTAFEDVKQYIASILQELTEEQK